MAGAILKTPDTAEKTRIAFTTCALWMNHQTIIALGAGGISKMYYPEENRLERIPNVTNYQEYIKRIDEMLDRKEKNLFMEVKKWQS